MRKVVASFFMSLDGVVEAPEEWAEFWPHQDPAENPMAAAINGLPKYVVSRSLQEAAWQSSTVLNGDLADEVSELKQQPGNDIAVSGSGTLVRSLIQEGLLDELRLLVHPVLVGSGARLFQGGEKQAKLELAESQALKSGVINLTYRSAT